MSQLQNSSDCVLAECPGPVIFTQLSKFRMFDRRRGVDVTGAKDSIPPPAHHHYPALRPGARPGQCQLFIDLEPIEPNIGPFICILLAQN